MTGILENRKMMNNLKKIALFSLAIITVSCSKETNGEQQFVEDNFLKIVDTVAYGKGTFISLQKDTIRYSDLLVNLNRKISYNKKMEEFTLSFFEDNPELKEMYSDILAKGNYSRFSLDSTFPKQIGKYHLDMQKNNKFKYAGKVDIENLKIYNDKAILILSESVEHVGVTSLILLKKERSEWKVFRREILMQS